MSQLQALGGQPQKPPKYAPIYTGRFFNGIYTNRSPLRAANAPHLMEKYYGDTSQDAMIAGLNIEVSNRLTLIRRPGNPLFDANTNHTYNGIDAFDEFRVNKGASDVFGFSTEEIFTMVDESGAGFLYSLDEGFERGGDAAYNLGLKFQKASGAGQSYMQSVGNSLYFADGVDNKKWLTSLFVRDTNGNNQFIQGADGLAGTYPFGTFLIDPATGNPQEFIGVSTGTVTAIAIASNVLTLTVTLDTTQSPNRDYKTGTFFQLYGLTSGADFLNGATVELSKDYHVGDTTLTALFTHADVSVAGQTGVLIQAGTTGDGVDHSTGLAASYVAKTGGSVPTWGTTIPSVSNIFLGSVTLDGNTVWINRGVSYGDGNQPSVMNWGIKAPTVAPSFSVGGHALSWQANTYYSPASVRVDPTHGNLWQITTPGKTGSSEPTWTASPTHQQKVVVTSIYADGVNIYCKTDTQSPALVAGDTLVFRNMCAFSGVGSVGLPDLNGVQVIVSATALSTTQFQAPLTGSLVGKVFGTSSHPILEYGQAVKTAGTSPASTITDGTAVWTCIQLSASLTWNAHTHYNVGDYLVAGSSLFQLGPKTQPWVISTPSMQYFTQSNGSHQDSDWQGAFFYFNTSDPAVFPPSKGYSYVYAHDFTPATVGVNSLSLQRTVPGGGNSADYGENAVNGAGEVGANTAIASGTLTSRFSASVTAMVFIPRAGTYTFTFQHNDGGLFSFDTTQKNLDTVASGASASNATTNNVPQTMTAQFGYGSASNLCGNNNSGTTGPGPFNQHTGTVYPADSVTWTFPQAGAYAIEIDYAKWNKDGGYMILMCPGSGAAPTQNLAVGRDESGTNPPSWPAFTQSGASYDQTDGVILWGANVAEVQAAGQQYTWNNLGPISDYVWVSQKNFTLPNTVIVDPNGNQEGPYETGITGTTQPNPWQTSVSKITADPGVPLLWMNEGPVPAVNTAGGTITATSAQGWLYWVALVNSLDQTVSNVGPVSIGTGQVVKGQITFAPGAGLNPNTIDPQADQVAIFRSTDGGATPLLIPGFVNSPYTVPLAQYLRYGYVDTVPDTELNNLIQGANQQENTPPASGAINLTYHLQRIWYSIGNTVYWTTGPLAPVGNGTDGTAPGNFATCESQVKRLVPTAIGMLVFTVSDIYIIAGNGTSTNPILPAIPYLTGVGLGNYNALDINGGLIGFFSTDKQFLMFNPSAGLSYVGFAIGDQFRLNNGLPGQSWDTTSIYVTYYTNGEDVGWYVGDAQFGWYKVIATPAPEQGTVSWSPFALVKSFDSLSDLVGIAAIKSVETSPGVHNLLIAQNSTAGYILRRDLSATTDGGLTGSNGETYIAFGVIGSIVLANSGQIAKIAYVTTESVKVGSPLVLGVLLDDALPYYTGSFDIIKDYVDDPPNLPPSRSFWSQRFYLAEDEDPAYCRHLQVMIQWPAENAQNELQTLTIFGAYEVEQ